MFVCSGGKQECVMPLNWNIKNWNFLVVQWLRLHTDNAGISGSISGQGPNIPRALHTTEHLTTTTKKKKHQKNKQANKTQKMSNVGGMCSGDILDIEQQVGCGKWWLGGGIHHDWDVASHYLLIAVLCCLPGRLKMSIQWKKSVYLTGFWLRFDYSCLHKGRVSVHYLCCSYEKTKQSYVESLLNKIS